jgi:CubicO group peptidase (beta-lactamase class C family)
MPVRWLLVLFLVAGLLPATASGQEAALSQRLNPVVDNVIRENWVTGAVVLVARKGHIVYRRAAGFADREANVPMREDAIFRLASMSKPIVTAAALALVDAGKLSFDDPVRKYLPDFRPPMRDGSRPEITVRHLLTHTAGFSYGYLEPEGGPLQSAGVSDGLDESPVTLDENLRRLAGLPLLFRPGSAWSYSLATDVLGAVVARAGGASLQEVVQRTVTGPLGMSDTGFSTRDAARLVAAYTDARPRGRKMTDPQIVPLDLSSLRFSPSRALNDKAFASGGAGMVATAGDYLKFAEALRLGGAPILRRATVQTMTTNAIADLPMRGAGPGWGYGMGVEVLLQSRQARSPAGQGSWGWQGVYGTVFWVDPRAEQSVVIMTNTALAGTSDYVAGAIRNAIYAGP